jgi:hypothetical protein
MDVRNVGILPQHYTASQSRIHRLETSPPWKPQNLNNHFIPTVEDYIEYLYKLTTLPKQGENRLQKRIRDQWGMDVAELKRLGEKTAVVLILASKMLYLSKFLKVSFLFLRINMF